MGSSDRKWRKKISWLPPRLVIYLSSSQQGRRLAMFPSARAPDYNTEGQSGGWIEHETRCPQITGDRITSAAHVYPNIERLGEQGIRARFRAA